MKNDSSITATVYLFEKKALVHAISAASNYLNIYFFLYSVLIISLVDMSLWACYFRLVLKPLELTENGTWLSVLISRVSTELLWLWNG